jgi:hypothetical protein
MEKIDVMLEPLRVFTAQVAAFLPRLLLGLLILVAGLFIAKAASFAVRRGLRAINFHVVSHRSGLDAVLQEGGTSADTTDLFGMLAYGLVILAALIVAFNGMGLSNVTELLARVMLFVPRVFVALLILAFGAYFARFVVGAVVSYCQGIGMGPGDAQALGRLARYAIMAFVVMIALEHLEIGGAIVRQTFLIVLGGVMLALALAFGLGGRDWAAAHLERWWPAPRGDEDRS